MLDTFTLRKRVKNLLDNFGGLEPFKALKQGQKYVRRELRPLFEEDADRETRERITALEAAFSAPVIGAVERNLNHLSRQNIGGMELLRELEEIYYRYRMYEAIAHRNAGPEEDGTPHIICSEALT